jgi:ABC-type bacteriocin/lantibiotic exporter with double-glycine peptidase domain
LLPVFLFQVTLGAAKVFVLSSLRADVDTVLTLRVLERILFAPFSYIERRSTGDLLMRVRSTAALRQLFTTTVLASMIDGVFGLGQFALIAYLSPTLAAVAVVIVALQIGTLLTVWATQRSAAAVNLEAQADSQGRLVQILSGAQTLKMAGAEAEAVDGWRQLFFNEVGTDISRGLVTGTAEAIMAGLRVLAPLAMLAVGIHLTLVGRLDSGSMIAATALALGAFEPVSSLLSNTFQVASAASYLERLDDVLDQEPAQPFRGGTAPPGDLVVAGLSFAYPGTTRDALRCLDLTIHRGEFVAIMGRSGSGKSTLAMLVAGLYEPDSGSIKFGGRPLATGEASSTFGFVPQAPFYFGGTLRENITLFRQVSDELVQEAAYLAGLNDVAAQLPHGLDTVLGEGAGTLSGGERQRIGLARALLRQPPLLVLDEATSALDEDMEARVLAGVRSTGASVLLITHRATVAATADRCLLMTDGVLRARSHVESNKPKSQARSRR